MAAAASRTHATQSSAARGRDLSNPSPRGLLSELQDAASKGLADILNVQPGDNRATLLGVSLSTIKFVPSAHYGSGHWPVHPGAHLDKGLTAEAPAVSWPASGWDRSAGAPGASDEEPGTAVAKALLQQVHAHPARDAPVPQPLFTLIMFDPDAPSPAKPTYRSWVHWLVTNCHAEAGAGVPGTAAHAAGAGGLATAGSGDTVVHYAPPTPPMGTHRYILLVARQTGRTGEALAAAGRHGAGAGQPQGQPQQVAPAGPGSARVQIPVPAQRGHFDVRAVLAKHGLAPVGLTYFTVDAPSGAQ